MLINREMGPIIGHDTGEMLPKIESTRAADAIIKFSLYSSVMQDGPREQRGHGGLEGDETMSSVFTSEQRTDVSNLEKKKKEK
jgi:hypothetical protein